MGRPTSCNWACRSGDWNARPLPYSTVKDLATSTPTLSVSCHIPHLPQLLPGNWTTTVTLRIDISSASSYVLHCFHHISIYIRVAGYNDFTPISICHPFEFFGVTPLCSSHILSAHTLLYLSLRATYAMPTCLFHLSPPQTSSNCMSLCLCHQPPWLPLLTHLFLPFLYIKEPVT